MTKPRAALLLAGLILFVVGCGDATPSATPSSPAASGSGAIDSPTPAASVAPSPAGSTTGPQGSPTGTPGTTPPSTATPTAAVTPKPTPAPPITAFPQGWVGTWTDPVTGGSGSLELTLTGKDSDFGGSITMDGTACLAGGLLTGSYDGREIEFVVGQRDVEIQFRGRADASTMSGTLTSGCDGMDGTWSVNRTSR